jgi:tetratricopeptide (TPR) repeat protein
VRVVVLCLAFSLAAGAARADTADDCAEGETAQLRIAACTSLIDSHTQPTEDAARAYKSRGGAYAEIGKQDEAIADFTAAIKLNPDYAIAYAGRGASELAKGDFGGAIADYAETIRLKPNYPAAFVSRGYAYLVKGDLDHAIADFSEALKLAPHSVIALNNRGLAHKQKGELDLALADYAAAIELNPSYALAYNNRGYVYEARGQKQQAIDDFRQALALDPTLVGARDGLKRMGAAPATTAETEALIHDGQALAQEHCASCHAIGKQGESLNKRAPAFRDLQRGYPILALREPLSRGIARPHDEMPTFVFSDHEIDMIIAYINSLAPVK